ncbi:MAG: RNA polymerase sigma factor [Proteobacteria bacterium]|nr:RNA polymerase sigma factor [Pseudomonadota bacterium]
MLHDREAFAKLVQIHQGKIRAFLVRLCKQYDTADDLAQDTFLKAYQKIADFKGSGSFSGWLFQIAFHCFLDMQRKTTRRAQVSAEYIAQMELSADRYDRISTEQMDLEKALAQLKEAETAAITLCHSFGFSHQEAADILKCPVGTVKTNINRGKEKLKQSLAKQKKWKVA